MEDNWEDEIYSNGYHGRGGPLKVSRPNFHTPLAPAYIEAGMELGYGPRDVNGPNQAGFMTPQTTTDGKYWNSAARAYLGATKNRLNLHVVTRALVHRILFDDQKRAVGVMFERNNENHIVTVSREVILSAGVFNSPQLLMLSGIGPVEELMMHNIPLVVDLPGVGQKLHDHVFPGGFMFTIEEKFSLIYSRMISNGIQNLRDYVLYDRGPFSSPVAVEGIAFIHTRFANRSINHPDIQLHSSVYHC